MNKLLLLVFFVTCIFPFFSASVMASFGLQQVRVVSFITILLLLTVSTVFLAYRVPLRNPSVYLVPLSILLLSVFCSIGDTTGLLDYKISLIALSVLIAPSLAFQFQDFDLEKLILWTLGGYVAITFITVAVLGPAEFHIGSGTFKRLDLTGSVVTHSSICTIFLVGALATISEERGKRYIVVLLTVSLSIAALWMIIATATRTVIFTLVIYFALLIFTSKKIANDILFFIIFSTCAVLTILTYSIIWNNSFILRLFGAQQDYSSGRLHSLVYWLQMIYEKPMGHGFGSVRFILGDNKQPVSDGNILEWPHNEFVRFWVEVGPIGFILIAFLFLVVIGLTFKSAQSLNSPLSRNLIIIICADFVARTVLQNYFNSVYESTVFLLILFVLCESRRFQAESFNNSRTESNSWPWLRTNRQVP